MEFNKIEKYFQANNTTKVNTTKYKSYDIKWFFEGFEKIISKTTFTSQISLNLDFQLDINLINQIDTEIDHLRKFYKTTSQAIQKYLLELKNETKEVKLYMDFLNNFYKNVKDYINEGLIPWVFSETMHYEIEFDNHLWKPDRFLEMKLLKLKIKTMKKMKEYIKNIAKELKDDEVFSILANAYKEQIELEENEYRKLKKIAKI